MKQFINTITSYWTVLSRYFMHKTQTKYPDDFWAWLSVRVNNRESRDYKNKVLVLFLLDNAMRENEYIRAIATFRDHQSMIESSWTDESRDRLLNCIDKAEELDFTDPRNRYPDKE